MVLGIILGGFWEHVAKPFEIRFFDLAMFFSELRCATRARRGREYGENGELAPWSGALIFKEVIL